MGYGYTTEAAFQAIRIIVHFFFAIIQAMEKSILTRMTVDKVNPKFITNFAGFFTLRVCLQSIFNSV